MNFEPHLRENLWQQLYSFFPLYYYFFFQKHQGPFVDCFYLYGILAFNQHPSSFWKQKDNKNNMQSLLCCMGFLFYPLALYLYRFLCACHFYIHHPMSSCNKAIIRWMDEETEYIQFTFFISFVAGVFNSSLNCIYILFKRKQIQSSYLIPIFIILMSLYCKDKEKQIHLYSLS